MNYTKETIAYTTAMQNCQEKFEDLQIEIRKKQALAEEYAALSCEYELKLKRLRAKGQQEEPKGQQEEFNRRANAAVDKVAEQAFPAVNIDEWDSCLGSVLASLKGYPNAGGDLNIMREVERIVREAIVREAKDTADNKQSTPAQHEPCQEAMCQRLDNPSPYPPAYERWINGADFDDWSARDR